MGLDFVDICQKMKSTGVIEIYPSFKVKKSKELMVKGKSFYAIWDPEAGLWSKNIYDVQRLVDKEIYDVQNSISPDIPTKALTLGDFSTKKWLEFEQYVKTQPDTSKLLDNKIIFANTEVAREDYASHKLPYALQEGPCPAYEELVSTLYSPEERTKFEWAIGSIIHGESKTIQKFIVFYGEAGTGKSTIINIIQNLFEGYYTSFEAKALASQNNSFATEAFRGNPLVAIQHDGDLSKIEDNTKLNSIIAHEEMLINEKYKAGYTSRINAFLFMGTNRPVKITDAKSGIIRRLIDVHPTGIRVSGNRYHELMRRIQFELGAIAYHCLEVFHRLGKSYYDGYRPLDMIFQTDVFFNFVEWNYETFRSQDQVTLKQAYDMYKQYCDESLVDFKLPRHKFREELKNYFERFDNIGCTADGRQVRSLYSGFCYSKFSNHESNNVGLISEDGGRNREFLKLTETTSRFDTEYAEEPAQYATKKGTPKASWEKVKTSLKDLDTSKEHYILIEDEHHIVVDFDLKDEDGNKSAELNLKEASKWPPTYAEFSKSGAGVHLHYIYEGDPSKLSRLYAPGVEVKVFTGNSALRRKLTKCNDLPIAKINSGLPLKEEKQNVYDPSVSFNEKAIRTMIEKNLRKEYHSSTKSSIDFIHKILTDSYNSDIHYDVTDMRQKVLTFASKSTNNSRYCVGLVAKMQFKSKDTVDDPLTNSGQYKDDELVFYDVEVFPNLFIVCWSYRDPEANVITMINPEPKDIEPLFNMKLIGFNNRRYDNHILYARYLGYSNQELFHLSQKIINQKDKSAFFSDAYGISYTDIFDFCSKKQGLKKWEIELGIHHQECPYQWNEEIPENKWLEIAEYCQNDVRATKATFEANIADFTAREILADLSGLTLNDTTNQHTLRIIFGNDKNPQEKFNYVDLSKPIEDIPYDMWEYLYNNTPLPIPKVGYPWSKELWFEPGVSLLPYFQGYKFEFGKSSYRGEDPGEGGYVYAKKGAYFNVALLDIASMHPSSLEDMWHFGPYTEKFSQIKQARIAIKHKDFAKLKTMLNGKLIKYVVEPDPDKMDALSYALKIAINSVYGLTSAKFDNKARDPRNIDNIVAKRGALFMIDLKHEVEARGFTVAHIKTDSIKIPNATKEIIDFVMDFGRKYGYEFEHEATYERMCLINDSVYIAKYDEHGIRTKGGKHAGEWTPTGARFAHPFVLKTLFTHEPIVFDDYCETRSVSASMYLDMNEGMAEGEHNYIFVGKTGLFCPIKKGEGGGELYRIDDEGKVSAVSGTSDYRWLEASQVKVLGMEDKINLGYFRDLVDSSLAEIAKCIDPEVFLEENGLPPWWNCGGNCANCSMHNNICDGLPF